MRLALLPFRVRPFMYVFVNPAVPYLLLTGYLVDPGNSRGTRKLARTPRLYIKKKWLSVPAHCLYLSPYLTMYIFSPVQHISFRISESMEHLHLFFFLKYLFKNKMQAR